MPNRGLALLWVRVSCGCTRACQCNASVHTLRRSAFIPLPRPPVGKRGPPLTGGAGAAPPSHAQGELGTQTRWPRPHKDEYQYLSPRRGVGPQPRAKPGGLTGGSAAWLQQAAWQCCRLARTYPSAWGPNEKQGAKHAADIIRSTNLRGDCRSISPVRHRLSLSSGQALHPRPPPPRLLLYTPAPATHALSKPCTMGKTKGKR